LTFEAVCDIINSRMRKGNKKILLQMTKWSSTVYKFWREQSSGSY